MHLGSAVHRLDNLNNVCTSCRVWTLIDAPQIAQSVITDRSDCTDQSDSTGRCDCTLYAAAQGGIPAGPECLEALCVQSPVSRFMTCVSFAM